MNTKNQKEVPAGLKNRNDQLSQASKEARETSLLKAFMEAMSTDPETLRAQALERAANAIMAHTLNALNR